MSFLKLLLEGMKHENTKLCKRGFILVFVFYVIVMLRHKSKKALVIGAGSGRDIASATLLSEGLRKNGTKVDLAGFLTPRAIHSFNGSFEKPINRLSTDSRKFSPAKKADSLDNYYEPLLLSLNEELDLGLQNIFLFSLQYGSKELARQFQNLVTSLDYDLIIATDVGGDILAGERDFPLLMTALVDLSCLKMLSCLQTNADMQLAVISPGVDGEIPRKRLLEILQNLDRRGCFLHVVQFRDSDEYEKFVEVNRQINLRTKSYSHTFEMIKRMIELNPEPFRIETYKKEIGIDQTTWSIPFRVELDPLLIDKIFFFDLRRIFQTTCTKGAKNSSVLEAFLDIKRRGAGGSEVDFSYIPLGLGDGTYLDPLFVLVPCNRAQGKLREEILSAGLSSVMEGRIRKALIMRRDFPFIPNDFVFGDDGDFMVIGK